VSRAALYLICGSFVVMAAAWYAARVDPNDAEEPSHPWWQVILGFVLTLAAIGGLTWLAIQGAEPDRAEAIIVLALGVSCLLLHPRVWWIWELPGLREWRLLAGDILVLLFYWLLGLVLIAFSVHDLVGMS
jgi:hypothetical protein